MKIFVYGTLSKGMTRSSVLVKSKFLGLGFIEGLLYDLGAYPGIVEGNNSVYGELYEIDTTKVKELDRIEGYSSEHEYQSLYKRKEVNVILINNGSQERAHAYFFNQQLKDNKLIDCRDYRRYILESSSDKQWYIAYGSNTSSARLNDRIKTTDGIKTGYLEGYKLMFNKKAIDGSVKANIAYIGSGYRCPFVAYGLKKEQLKILDGHEGEPFHYVRIGISFPNIASGTSYIGHIYIANTSKLIQDRIPANTYLEHIYAGYEEHGFDTSGLPKICSKE